MKKTIVVLLLCVIMVSSFAFAEQYIYGSAGNSNVRSGPGLDYDAIGVLGQGDYLPYNGYEMTDDRGVAWYSVSCSGENGWVSSRFAEIVSGPYISSTSAPESVDDASGLYVGEVTAELSLFESREIPGYVVFRNNDGSTICEGELIRAGDDTYLLSAIDVLFTLFEENEKSYMEVYVNGNLFGRLIKSES